MRGGVAGWDPTVPRAELTAYLRFLARAGPNSEFVGDCKAVIDAAVNGVPHAWTTSVNPNADLWCEALRRQRDHGALPRARKVQAHRARSRAADEGEDALRSWHGNAAADDHAKSLAKDAAAQAGVGEKLEQHRARINEVLIRLAVAAAWHIKHRIVLTTKAVKRHLQRDAGNEMTDGGSGLHDVRARTNGGWECSRCRGFAASKAGLRILTKRRCLDVQDEQVHSSHVIAFTNGITWCRVCGCFTSRWPRELRAPCQGYLASPAQANVRRRLECGLLPTTAAYLHVVAETHEREAQDHRQDGEGGERRGPKSGRQRAGQGRIPYVGRYLRLPGGPLARQPPTMSTLASGTGDAAVDADGAGVIDVEEMQLEAQRPSAGDAAPLPAHDDAHAAGDDAGGDGGDAGRDVVHVDGETSDVRGPTVDLIGARGGRAGPCSARDDSGGDADARRRFTVEAAVAEAVGPAFRRHVVDAALVAPVPSEVTEHFGDGGGAGDAMSYVARAPAGGGAAAAAGIAPRRRIRGKSSPPSTAASSGASASRWCSSPSSAGWSRRLLVLQAAGKARCHVCGGITSCKCRGCNLRLCIMCARSARPCIVERQINEAS